MELVLFEKRNNVPDGLKIGTLAVVLNPDQTNVLNEWGGVVNLLSYLYPKKHFKYRPFELSIGERAVLLFRGWGEDTGCGYLRMKLEENFGNEEFVHGTDLPSHAEMMISHVPRTRNRLFVFVDTSLPPRRQYSGRMLTAYRPPEGVGENDIWGVLMPQSRGEYSSKKVFIFRAWNAILCEIAKQLGALTGEECRMEYRELPAFNYLLARRTYTTTGHSLKKAEREAKRADIKKA